MSFDALASGWARVLGVDRKQFNMFFERMMDGFAYHKIVVDKAGKPFDFVFLEVNSAFEKLTGLKRENIIGKRVTEVLKGIENDPADWIGVYGRVALAGESAQFENYAKPLDKWYRVNAYCPAKGYFVALFEDITERKKAELALRESETRFRTVADFTYDCEYWVSPEGRVLYISPACKRLSGYEAQEFMDDPELFKKIAHPDDATLFAAHFDKFDSTTPHKVDFRIITRAGEVRWVEHVCQAVFSPDGQLLGRRASNRDITDRKQAEKKLRETEQRWSTTLSSIGDAVITTDLDGNVAFLNGVAEGLTGWSAVDALGKPLLEVFNIINEKTRGKVDSPVSRVLKEGLVVGLANAVLVRKDGSEVPIDDSGAPIRDKEGNVTGVVLVFRDIAERKKTEAKIAEQAFMLANVNDAIIGYSYDQKVKFWNKAAEKLYGYTSEEVLDKVGFDLLKPVYINVTRQELLDKIAIQGHNESESVRQTKDGRSVAVEAHVILLRDEAGKPVGYVSVDRDITERKKAEEALRESEARLERSQEIAHLGSWELDLKENKLTWSDEVYRIFGLKPQEFGATYEAFLASVHPDDRQAVDAAYSGSIREGKEGYEIEHRVVRKDNGEIRVVHEKCTHVRDESGQIVKSLGMIHDITERKKAEHALWQVKNDWERTFDSVPDLIAIVDNNYRIVRANKAMAQALGVTPQQAIGLACFSCVHGTTAPPEFCPHAKTIQDGKEHVAEVHEPRLGGDFFVSTTPLLDEKGCMIGSVHVARNITRRKKNEEALAKQAALIDLSPDAIIVKKLDGTITFWSHGAETLYGWSKEEAIGQTTHNLLKTDFPMPLNEILMQVASRGLWSGELVHTTKAGRKLFVQSHWLGRFGKNTEIVEILETNVDISERKQMQDKLEEYAKNLEGLVEERTKQVTEERQRMYNVLETLPAYVVLLDKDHNVPFANKVFRERFGESQGRRCYEFLFNRESPCENCETYKVLKTDKPHRWEWTGPDKRDYDIYDFPFTEVDGSKLILEMGIDITQRKKAEAKVQAASLYSRSLIEASLDPLVTISPEGKITDVNKATELATGCPRNSLIGSDFSDYFTEPEKAKTGYKQVFTEGFVKDYPLAIRHKTGKITDVLYNAAVYRSETGEIQGVFAAARDITERKKAEAQAEESARKLKDAERLAAIGATAGMVGHDIRNPLQAIIGDLYLAKSDVTCLPSGELKDSLTESIDAIQKSVDYVNKIVQDLQDYAKPLKPVLHDTDLHAIINDILKKTDTPKNIKIQQRITEEAKTLKVDPDLLKRILGNLISNAIQAMPDGGKLTIRARRKKRDVILTVKDTGTGIPETAKANLFTPLFTTKSKGQGFGLAVVKRMTEALGGTATFESEEGKGAEFTIRLPQEANRK